MGGRPTRSQRIIRQSLAAALGALLAACAAPPRIETTPPCPPAPVCPGAPAPMRFEPADFSSLPGWRRAEQAAAWSAWLASCRAIGARAPWQAVCEKARALGTPDDAAARRFFEENFVPWRAQGGEAGLVTGYYEPLLHGSRRKHPPYVYPLYAPPDDLIAVDLAAVAPQTANLRLRGRLEGRKLVPYYSRAEIEQGLAPLAGKELLWVDDPLAAFFLQVQGSGRVALDDGSTVRLLYADQNGRPYRSIGRVLIEKGELAPQELSLGAIRRWAKAHPQRLAELLDQNPSYVFFRESPLGDPASGPPGTLGVPLSAGRSIAVDPRYVTLGAPVFLVTTDPQSGAPLARLVLAQDTGGAIRGPQRADLFFGFGETAEEQAGRMRAPGTLWVLLPRGYAPTPP